MVERLRARCPQLEADRVYPEEGYSPQDRRVVSLSAGEGRLTGPSDRPPEEAALAFLSEYRDIWGIQDVERDLELDPARSRPKPDTSGMRRLRFWQTVSGVPLLGDGFLVTLDRNGSIVWVDGTIEPLAIGAPLDPSPSIDNKRALEIATARHGPVSHGTPDVELVARFEAQGVRLCWSVEYTGNGWWYLLIDANDGQVVREVDKVRRADYTQVDDPAITPLGRRVTLAARMYNPDSDRPIWSLVDMTLRPSVYTGFAPPGANDWLRGAGTADFHNRTGVFSSGLERSGTAAHRNLGRILLHWRETFGRDSYDDDGGGVHPQSRRAVVGLVRAFGGGEERAFQVVRRAYYLALQKLTPAVCFRRFRKALYDVLRVEYGEDSKVYRQAAAAFGAIGL